MTHSDGRSAEQISVREDALTTSVYTPAALVYSPPGLTNEVDVVRPSSSLRQVKTPQTLADVVVISSSEFDVRFYRPADVGAKVNGIYSVSGQPFVTWKIKNPNPPANTRLQITKIQNSTTDTSEYTWDAVSDSWTLTRGGGSVVETKTISSPTPTARTDTYTVKDASGTVASKIAKTYQFFPWGEELVQEVVDPDAAALTSSYAYYEEPSEVYRYRKVKSVTRPDGSWEKYDYDYASNIALVLRPWKDLALDSATPSNSRATYFYYYYSDGVMPSFFARTPGITQEYVNGILVRTENATPSSEIVNGQLAFISTAAVNSSASVTETTRTARYHPSATTLLANRLAFIEYPDGRKDTYSYEKGVYTPNANPELSLFTPDANGKADREIVVHGTITSPNGVALKTTKETTVRNEFGNLVQQETYVYTGSAYERIAWTVNEYDDRGHLTRTTRHNGPVITQVWDGDKKASEIDESGIETTYSYDAPSRVQTKTQKGVAAAGGFPAQPDIVTTYTYDAAGRQLSETVSAGGLSLVRSTAYDKAGRVIRETDDAGLVTQFSYANGGRTQTVTRPGGVTQVIDRFLDGQTKSETGSAVVTRTFDYGANADGTQFTQEFIGPAGLASPRWTKTTTDWLGRVIRVERPSFTGTNFTQTFAYNNKGQLVSETAFEGAVELQADKLHEYDTLGEKVRTGSDIDASGSLTAASTDRLVEMDVIFEKTGADWFRVATTKNYLINNSATALTQTRRERLTNFAASGTEKTVSDVVHIDVSGNSTRATVAVDRTAKKLTETSDTPESSTNAVRISVNGLLQSSAPATPESATTYAYDALGRLTGTTSPRTGTTTRGYSGTTGQLISTNDGAGSTSYEYYPAAHASAGRLKSQTNAAGKKTYFNYSGRGELTQTWGDTTYPLEYVFDAYGQRTELHTFRSGNGWQLATWPASSTGTADVTRWIYHEPTGLQQQKRDAANQGANYTYDALGRLRTRTWARLSSGNPLVTTYSFDPNNGDLTQIDYSDSTPDVAFTAYDRAGRPTALSDAAGTHTLSYNVNGELQGDQVAGGILDGVNLSVGYDSFLRRNSLQASRSAASLLSQTYGYDTSTRLQTITGSGETVTYGYNPTRGLMETTTYSSGTSLSRVYDSLGRLQSITTTPPASPAISYSYTYNNLHQRTRVTREDGAYWSYGYNGRGEVVSGKKYWVDNSPVAGMQFEYGFDNLGNRNSAKSGGNNQGGGLRESTYAANSLNQYTQRTVPGAVDVVGTANAAAVVTVNNQATERKGDYFRKALALDNATAPIYSQVDVVGVKNGAGPGGEDAVVLKSGQTYLPKTPELFTHDADGNLTTDGRWTYTWDAENRLIMMEAIATVPTAAKLKLEFACDSRSRRIQKLVYNWNTGTSSYQLQSTTKFVYDGWNLLAELDASNNLIRSYVWGQDLSGSLQGTGGIGGLLTIGEASNNYLPAYDGSGNVTALIKASSSERAAAFEYGPFGETLTETGDAAGSSPFRFSTRYTDGESTSINYGYRFYGPVVGRWLSRDPSEERGGTNLYTFVSNKPTGAIDLFGLEQLDVLFGAFIPARIGKAASQFWGSAYSGITGSWFDEPGSAFVLTATDHRDFGGGAFRVRTTGSIDSNDIGKLKGKYESKFVTSSDPSESIRRSIFGTGIVRIVGTEKPSAIVWISDVDPCESRVTVRASGQYPISWTSLSGLPPNIDYKATFVFKKEESGANRKGTIKLEGWHNRFPNYEGQLRKTWVYSFSTSYSGPGFGSLMGMAPIEGSSTVSFTP